MVGGDDVALGGSTKFGTLKRGLRRGLRRVPQEATQGSCKGWLPHGVVEIVPGGSSVVGTSLGVAGHSLGIIGSRWGFIILRWFLGIRLHAGGFLGFR